MFIQKDMASRNVLSVLLRVCDKAAGMPGLTHSIAYYFLSTRGDYFFLLFQESVMAKAKLALLRQ